MDTDLYHLYWPHGWWHTVFEWVTVFNNDILWYINKDNKVWTWWLDLLERDVKKPWFDLWVQLMPLHWSAVRCEHPLGLTTHYNPPQVMSPWTCNSNYCCCQAVAPQCMWWGQKVRQIDGRIRLKRQQENSLSHFESYNIYMLVEQWQLTASLYGNYQHSIWLWCHLLVWKYKGACLLFLGFG